MDRTIHFGDDEADARYRIQDTSSTGGDFVLAEDLDGGTVLLEYDYSASEWVSRGPVNLSGNDITNAGSISAATLEAGNIKNIDTGIVSTTGVDASDDDNTWETKTTKDVTVTFNEDFDNPPKVAFADAAADIAGTGDPVVGGEQIAEIIDIRADSFDLRFIQMRAVDRTSIGYQTSWIAYE